MNYTISNRMSHLRGSSIREIFKYAADPEVISLAGGNPAPELFPAEELAQMEDSLVYVLYEETGEKIPMAINVTDSSFMASRLNYKKTAYLCFVAGTERSETCKVFYDYFMAYQPK